MLVPGPLGRGSGAGQGQLPSVTTPWLPRGSYKALCGWWLPGPHLEVCGKGCATSPGWLPPTPGLGQLSKRHRAHCGPLLGPAGLAGLFETDGSIGPRPAPLVHELAGVGLGGQVQIGGLGAWPFVVKGDHTRSSWAMDPLLLKGFRVLVPVMAQSFGSACACVWKEGVDGTKFWFQV